MRLELSIIVLAVFVSSCGIKGTPISPTLDKNALSPFSKIERKLVSRQGFLY